MNRISRRRFLKIAGFGAGAAALAAASTRPLSGAMPAGTAGVHTVPTYCDICFWKCNAVAHVRDGRLWKIDGNPDDPLCQGRLCPRGTGGIGAHYDPDRLRAPLMRHKARGEEKWVEVTWDEALGYIAERMQTIKARYGPEAVALFSHGIGGTFLKHTLKAYGITNIAAPSFAQCRGPRDVGFNLTFGEEIGSPERTDIRNARCLVLIGSHLGENMHNTQVQEFAEAIGNGATIIVADPRFSIAASKAKHYLPVKPGTGPRAAARLDERARDRGPVRQGLRRRSTASASSSSRPNGAVHAGVGLSGDGHRARGDPRDGARNGAPPSCDAGASGPPRHLVRRRCAAQPRHRIAERAARQLGSQGRLLLPVEHGRAGLSVSALSAVGDAARWTTRTAGIRSRREAITTGIREATITGQPYPIKGWFVYATNLIHAMPNQAETIQAIQRLDLLVVVDVIPSRDRRVGRRRAARGHLPRALRRPQCRDLP